MSEKDIGYAVRLVNLAQDARRAKQEAEARRARRKKSRRRVMTDASLIMALCALALLAAGLAFVLKDDWRSAAVLAYAAASSMGVSALLWEGCA